MSRLLKRRGPTAMPILTDGEVKTHLPRRWGWLPAVALPLLVLAAGGQTLWSVASRQGGATVGAWNVTVFPPEGVADFVVYSTLPGGRPSKVWTPGAGYYGMPDFVECWTTPVFGKRARLTHCIAAGGRLAR